MVDRCLNDGQGLGWSNDGQGSSCLNNSDSIRWTNSSEGLEWSDGIQRRYREADQQISISAYQDIYAKQQGKKIGTSTICGSKEQEAAKRHKQYIQKEIRIKNQQGIIHIAGAA